MFGVSREKNLYLCAKELEESVGLREEMTVWDGEFGQDGLVAVDKITDF